MYHQLFLNLLDSSLIDLSKFLVSIDLSKFLVSPNAERPQETSNAMENKDTKTDHQEGSCYGRGTKVRNGRK